MNKLLYLKGIIDMENIIKKIMLHNQSWFGDTPIANRIDIGFTNTLYNINDKYIIKICTDINNEEKFKKEIDFYNTNKENILIPKLFLYDTTKRTIPYMYEILEKIDGVSLYDVWYKLEESKREFQRF